MSRCQAKNNYGYAGEILRINLTSKSIVREKYSEKDLRKFIGGAGLGIQIIATEVDPDTNWDSPLNKLILASGPLSGTSNPGSGTICIVTKGVLTGGIASSQANGFFGAFLKFNGYDAIILEGRAPSWSYIAIENENVEILDGRHLLGLDTWQLESQLRRESAFNKSSVLSIGPAGENLVKFACISCDEGHIAAHNGIGAVLGAKKIKGIILSNGKHRIPLHSEKEFWNTTRKQRELTRGMQYIKNIEARGTAGGVPAVYKMGLLPIKNYTTNITDEENVERLSGQYFRDHFQLKPAPCFACNLKYHCHKIEIPDSPLSGFQAEEPEYEAMASLGSNLGIFDPKKVAELSNYCDRIGIDLNETGWLIGWIMECYERGVFSQEDLYNLNLEWGNADDVYQLLLKISQRLDGLANIFANGVKQAAETLGGEAKHWAVYTEKGNTPRGHDHRANWFEHLDTCVSNTGTIESTGRAATPEQHQIPPAKDKFDYQEVARQNAQLNGRRMFEDCLGICGFCSWEIQLLCDAVKHATGWDFSLDEAMQVGKRLVAMMRIYNCNAGISSQNDRPSFRYGEKIKDGPLKGKELAPIYPEMVNEYYRFMEWDENGIPTPETMKKLEIPL